MFEEVTQKRNRWRVFWPDVNDLDGAKEAIRLGYGSCFVLAGLNVIVAAFEPAAGFAGAIVFGVLGLLVRRRSRTAAVAAAGFIALSIIGTIYTTGLPIVGVVPIIVLVCLLSSVRGTFAYRKLIRIESGKAVEPFKPGTAL